MMKIWSFEKGVWCVNRLTAKAKKGGIYQPLYVATTAAFNKLSRYEDTGLEPEEIEELKTKVPSEGEWMVFEDGSGNKRYKCSVCEKSVARNSQKSRYCPSCGASLVR